MKRFFLLPVFILFAFVSQAQLPDSIAKNLVELRKMAYPERMDKISALGTKFKNQHDIVKGIMSDELEFVLANSKNPMAIAKLNSSSANMGEWNAISAEISKTLSRAYGIQGKEKKAIKELRKAITSYELAKDTIGLLSCYPHLGNMLNHGERYEESILQLEICCSYAGKVSMAKSDLDGCIYMLVTAYWAKEEYGKARNLLNRNIDEMIEAKPINEGIFQIMNARGESLAGNKQAALNILKPLVDSIDNHKGITGIPVKKHLLNNYVEILHALNRHEETKVFYQSIIKYQEKYDKDLRESAVAKVENSIQQLEDEQKIKELESDKILASAKLRGIIFGLLSLFAVVISGIGFWLYRQRQKQREHFLLTSKEKETQKFREKLLTSVTHELRTPLSIISGKLESLADSKSKQEDQSHLEVAQRNTKQLVGQINQLLEWNKLEANALKNLPTMGDAEQVMEAIVEELKPIAENKQLEWVIGVKEQDFNGMLDYSKFQTVARNLISNAIKYSDISSKIQLKLSQENAELVFSVQDFGPGIPKEHLAKIFDWYYRVASESQISRHEGFGIGLSLSKELAGLMNGSLSVASEEGEGATFILRVPFENVKEHQDPSAEIAAPMGSGVSQSYSNPEDTKILIVEDHPDMAAHMASLFREGYQVPQAHNLKQGRSIAENEIPDIIISDVMLPDGSGLDLCRALKSQIVTDHIPILMLTARGDDKIRYQSLQNRADAFLNKPFNNRELQLTVSNLLQNRRILHLRFGSQKEKMSESINPFNELVLKILEENFSDNRFDVEKFSRALTLSTGQAYRKIRATFDTTPKKLIRNFRLERAKIMLENKDLNIAEIAYTCGFTSPEYFSTAFKDVFAKSPSEFRLPG